MPCGKESSPRIAIGRKLLTEEPSCEAEDMTAPETFTAASKKSLTTGRCPDTTVRALCAWVEIGAGFPDRGEILIQPVGWAEASRRWQRRIRKTCVTA